MFKILFKSKTFLKYLISYAVVLLIPTLIFLACIQYEIIPQIRSDIIEANLENLEKTKEQMEMRLLSFDRVAVNMSVNQKLTPYAIKNSYYKKYEAIQELKKYQSSSDMAEDIFYYVLGDDRIYTANNEADIGMFFNDMNHIKGWDADYFVNLIKETKTPEFKNGTMNGTEHLFFLYPIMPNSSYACAVFVIDSKIIRQLLESALPRYNQSVMIYDSKNDIIVCSNSKNDLSEKNRTQVLSRVKQGDQKDTFLVDGDQYLVAFTKSQKNSLFYISVVDNNLLMASVSRVTEKVLISVTVVFVLGTVAMFLWSFWNYLPIYRLRKKISEKMTVKMGAGRDFDTISGAFDDVMNNYSQLKNSFDKNTSILREYVFKELIKCNDSSIQALVDQICLESSENRYFLCAVIDRNEKLLSVKELSHINHCFLNTAAECHRRYGDRVSFFNINTENKNSFILIITVDGELFEAADTISREVCSKILAVMDTSSVAAIGNPYNDILSIGKSYMEAESVLQRISLKEDEKHAIFCYNSFEEVKNSGAEAENYPNKDIKMLLEQLEKGDTAARDTMLTIFHAISDASVPRFLARCIVLDIFNRLLKILMDTNMTYSLIKEKYVDGFSPEKSTNAEQFNQNMIIACVDMCNDILEQVIQRNESSRKMVEYLHTNFCDNMFSVGGMADEFNLTTSGLGHIFKQYTGMTVNDYLWELRLEKAKKLLDSGDIPVKDIIADVGYFDASSFIRKFKNSVGMTPGQYRNSIK